MFKFQNLKVWQKAIILCDKVLNFVDTIPAKGRFSLAEQLRRAAISILTNIAEGSERRSKKEAAQFYNIARASCAETVNLLVIALKRGYFTKEKFQKFYMESEEISKMLYPLIIHHKENLHSPTSNPPESGQSLIEMIIAIAIILTGLIGALALTISNLSGTQESNTRVVASNLAREGIDVVRNIRDTNWLKNLTWDAGLYFGTDYTAIAVFNPTLNQWQLNFSPNNIDDAAAKLYRLENNLYIQDISPPEGVETLYSRLLTLDPICFNSLTRVETISGGSCGLGEEKIGIRVKSEVTWIESGRSHKITLEDRLYNWK